MGFSEGVLAPPWGIGRNLHDQAQFENQELEDPAFFYGLGSNLIPIGVSVGRACSENEAVRPCAHQPHDSATQVVAKHTTNSHAE